MNPPTPDLQELPSTNLHSYSKGTPTPTLPTHRKYHPPTDYSHTNGPPYTHPYPQLTGITTHHLTTFIH